MNITNCFPYRQLAAVEKEIPVKADGLIIRMVVPHKCNLPNKYTIFFKRKILFGLISYSTSRELDIPAGSLFKCHDCKKIYHRKYLSESVYDVTYWSSPSSYEVEEFNKLWEEEALKENNIIK